MTEEALTEVEVQIETPEAEVEQVDKVNTEVEDKARTMGWKPQDEYKGDPNRWTDAESFVKVGEERIPVMKENFNKIAAKNAELEAKMNAMEEFQKESSKRSYDRAVKDLQSQQRQAVEEADTDKFDELRKQEEQIKADYSPKESTQPAQNNVAAQEVAEWQSRNTWYQTPSLAAKAADIEMMIMNEEAYKQSQDYTYRPMNLPDRLNEVSRRVQADLAPREQARKLPAVEGTRVGSSKPAAKTWGDIPAADRAKGNEWIKRGVLTQADYVKDYFGE